MIFLFALNLSIIILLICLIWIVLREKRQNHDDFLFIVNKLEVMERKISYMEHEIKAISMQVEKLYMTKNRSVTEDNTVCFKVRIIDFLKKCLTNLTTTITKSLLIKFAKAACLFGGGIRRFVTSLINFIRRKSKTFRNKYKTIFDIMSELFGNSVRIVHMPMIDFFVKLQNSIHSKLIRCINESKIYICNVFEHYEICLVTERRKQVPTSKECDTEIEDSRKHGICEKIVFAIKDGKSTEVIDGNQRVCDSTIANNEKIADNLKINAVQIPLNKELCNSEVPLGVIRKRFHIGTVYYESCYDDCTTNLSMLNLILEETKVGNIEYSVKFVMKQFVRRCKTVDISAFYDLCSTNVKRQPLGLCFSTRKPSFCYATFNYVRVIEKMHCYYKQRPDFFWNDSCVWSNKYVVERRSLPSSVQCVAPPFQRFSRKDNILCLMEMCSTFSSQEMKKETTSEGAAILHVSFLSFSTEKSTIDEEEVPNSYQIFRTSNYEKAADIRQRSAMKTMSDSVAFDLRTKGLLDTLILNFVEVPSSLPDVVYEKAELRTYSTKGDFITGHISGDASKESACLNDSKMAATMLDNDNAANNQFSEGKGKHVKVVVRGIPVNISTDSVKKGLDSFDLDIIGLTRMTFRKKKPLPLFLLTLNWSPASDKIFSVKEILGFAVTVELYKKVKQSVQQCFRCQGFNHLSKDCPNAERCVRCGKDHATMFCVKPRTERAACANCGGEHPANFRGCPMFPKINRK